MKPRKGAEILACVALLCFALAILILAHVIGPLAFIGTQTHCWEQVKRKDLIATLRRKYRHVYVDASLVEFSDSMSPDDLVTTGPYDCPRHFVIANYPFQPFYDDQDWLGWMEPK